MKNKGIVIFLIVLAIVIIAVMAMDFLSTRPDKRPENPYELNVDQYKSVNPDLILYKETKNFKLKIQQPSGIVFYNNQLIVAGDSLIQIIGNNGTLISEFFLPDHPSSITINSEKLYVSFEAQLLVYNLRGELIQEFKDFDADPVLTSVAVYENNVFVADAGNRKVIHFLTSGEKINEFEGKHEEESLHGFIIPSANFDLNINENGELWVVNPGAHALENYAFDGTLRGFWEKTSMQIEGFSGCCNPARFAFLPNGNFVTSEKGLVRIKIYKPSGELVGVVAAPDKFEDDGHAPELAIDETGNIYALDVDKKMIRLFQPN